FLLFHIAQETVNIKKTVVRQHRFPGYDAIDFVQKLVKFHLITGARREFTMSTLSGERAHVLPVPKKSSFAQAGAGCEHSDISRHHVLSVVNRMETLLVTISKTIRRSFEIVNQIHLRNIQVPAYFIGIQRKRKPLR